MAIRKNEINGQTSLVDRWCVDLTSSNRLFLTELWTDLYAPNSSAEVAVHSEKLRQILDVCSLFKKKHGGILLLTGPSGSSKSACLLAVCKSLGFSEARIWFEENSDGMGSPLDETQQFEEFLFRCSRYSGNCDSNKIDFDISGSTLRDYSPQLVLIEYLPLGLAEMAERFHDCLRKIMSQIVLPTVFAFVLTKSSSCNTFGTSPTCNFDNTAITRLFPDVIKHELGVVHIDFNPVAPSIMLKGLQRIVSFVCNEKISRPPAKSLLQSLCASSGGDFRLAVNNLQLLLLPGLVKPSKSTAKFSLDPRGRDSGLAIFHALGKILYAKRTDEKPLNPESHLPSHLSGWKRQPLAFNPETVLDQSGLSGDEVIAWLHENYPLFHTTDFENLVFISSHVGWADAFLSGGMNWRLGLTPAADRNASSSSSPAGSHYGAMVVARSISLMNSSSGARFRPLKAPQSKQVDARCREVLESLKSSLDRSGVARVRENLIGGLQRAVLDRLPMEIELLGSVNRREIGEVCRLRRVAVDKAVRSFKRPAEVRERKNFGFPQGRYLFEGENLDADLNVAIDEGSSDNEI